MVTLTKNIIGLLLGSQLLACSGEFLNSQRSDKKASANNEDRSRSEEASGEESTPLSGSGLVFNCYQIAEASSVPRETLDLFCGFYSGDPFDHFYANEYPKADLKMTNMAGETIPAVRFQPMAYVGSPYNFHYRVSPDQLTEGLIIPKLQISESLVIVDKGTIVLNNQMTKLSDTQINDMKPVMFGANAKTSSKPAYTTNQVFRYDVNGDGYIVGSDLLLVINELLLLKGNSPYDLDVDGDGALTNNDHQVLVEKINQGPLLAPTQLDPYAQNPENRFDVNGDGKVTINDREAIKFAIKRIGQNSEVFYTEWLYYDINNDEKVDVKDEQEFEIFYNATLK